MMNVILRLGVLACGLVFALAGAAAAREAFADGPVLELAGPDGWVRPGEAFDVRIMLRGVVDVAGWELDLEYDGSLVELTGVTSGDFLGQGAGCDPDGGRCASLLGPLEEDSSVSLGGYSYGSGDSADGEGIAAILHFRSVGPTAVVGLEPIHALIAAEDGSVTVPQVDATRIVLGAPYRLFLPALTRS